MKKLLLLLFSILISFNSYGEKYSCDYLYNGKVHPVSFERQGNYFYKSNGVSDAILFEDQYVIVLSDTYSNDPPQTYTTLINKEKLNFVFVGLEFGNSSEIVEGPCSVTE